MSADFDVVIVGGGAAGIGAARHLTVAGKAVALCEASGRLGGRAFTQEVAGFPLDLGCGWLHSGDRNPWVGIAAENGFDVDRRESPRAAPTRDHLAARQAYDDWSRRLPELVGVDDQASAALEPDGPWNAYVRAVAGFMSGVEPERISVADYTAYAQASTRYNWSVPLGYGSLVAASLPSAVTLRLATPVSRIDLGGDGVFVVTRAGTMRARAVILTVSTAVLAGTGIRLPSKLDPWRDAAARLPLGRNEKMFLEIEGDRLLDEEGFAFGNLHDARSGAYRIRPLGRPVVGAFLGGESARIVEAEGPSAGFSHVLDELVALFGGGLRSALKPLIASGWSRMTAIGGAYSCALPGFATARAHLARPYADRIFFAGEATHCSDFSTAHGAFESGMRAAREVLTTLDQQGATR